ncbi:MAG: putative RNA-binding protein [Bacillota bacterium]|jgi:RNA-binding protein YlmH|nr:putative RNA-binding protein [Bacillota bacterium]
MKNVNLEKYYDFIKDEESKIVVKKIQDKISYVNKNFSPALTEFINPYVAELSVPLINNFNINYELFPSYEYGERKVFILYPDYLERVNADDYIAGIRIKNKSKFKILDHKDYLGSLMSLGIDRNKTGDIFVYEDFADIVVHKDIVDYIIYNLEKIGNSKIEFEILKADEIAYKEQKHEILNITSSSLRLDNILKHITNKSRDIATSLINSGDVKVNYVVEERVTYLVKENDMLSVRKFGRFKISKLMGLTKSGKNKIEIKHYV